MIASGYTLDLYCDVEVDDVLHRGVSVGNAYGCDQFYGKTGAEARRAARAAGWKFDMKTGRAVCPTCAKGGRSLCGLPTT